MSAFFFDTQVQQRFFDAQLMKTMSGVMYFNLIQFDCCGHVHTMLAWIYKYLFCAGVGPPRHTQCATSPVCTILRVVGPLGRGRRDPGPAMRGPAPGAEVALGKPSLLCLSSLADFKPVSSDRPRTTSAVPAPTFFGPDWVRGGPRAPLEPLRATRFSRSLRHLGQVPHRQ